MRRPWKRPRLPDDDRAGHSRPRDGDRHLQVVVVTGIFPPDIGGPATHASDLARELERRGHGVTVLTLTDEPSPLSSGRVRRWPRRWPWPARLVAVACWLVWRRRSYEVIYATGLHPAAIAGGRLAGRPVVAKMVGDPAWERGSRLGTVEEGFEAFQQRSAHGLNDRAMRWLRNWCVRHATAVTVPSEDLRTAVERWQGGRGSAVHVVPNGVAIPPDLSSGDRVGATALRVLCAGRLVPVKRYDLAIEAVAKVPGVTLRVAGDGPERADLERRARSSGDAIRLLGPLGHEDVLRELAHSDVLLSTSAYEGLPHAVIEALSMGVPVVASAVGGTQEAVVDGMNGRLLPSAPTADAIADVLAELRDDKAGLARLAAGAKTTGGHWNFGRCTEAVEQLLRSLTDSRPRLVSVGKSVVGMPPGPDVEQRLEVIAQHLRPTLIASGRPGIHSASGARILTLPTLRPTFLDGVFFYAVAPVLAVGVALTTENSAVMCQSPYEAFGVAVARRLVPRSRRPRLVVEVHGDWRSASRVYGSPKRRVASPFADRAARWSLRHADYVRVISGYTEELARATGYKGPMDRFAAFSDYRLFADLPARSPCGDPKTVFIGVLDRPKGPDVLLAAWQKVVADLPLARLDIVGDGPLRSGLEKRAAETAILDSVAFLGLLPRRHLAELMDEATCLVLPSRSEGLGRVILEAMLRARPVVASRVGGIVELVDDGVTGRLVPPDDPSALAQALVEVLSDPERAAEMGNAGRGVALARDPAREFCNGIARLAQWLAQT